MKRNEFGITPITKNWQRFKTIEDELALLNKWPMVVRNNLLTKVIETEKGYKIEVEVPGVKKENLTIELKDNAIIISAMYNEEKEEKDGENVIFSERKSGSMERVLSVPEGTREEDIHASLNDGLLTIEIDKNKEREDLKEDKKMIAIQ